MASDNFAEIGGVGGFQSFGFELFDFAGAENFDGHSAGFTFDIVQTEDWNIHGAVARGVQFAADDEARGMLDGFEERNGEIAGLHVPIGDGGTLNLIDRDSGGDVNA